MAFYCPIKDCLALHHQQSFATSNTSLLREETVKGHPQEYPSHVPVQVNLPALGRCDDTLTSSKWVKATTTVYSLQDYCEVVTKLCVNSNNTEGFVIAADFIE
ncbi:unnamed protein product [Ilex paraguariensis]|uniref:Uncharacterized protein n=1 Tax=Ilex paraguariensis TaxID=185542 RepID=A0ABC8S9U5_9AQUA